MVCVGLSAGWYYPAKDDGQPCTSLYQLVVIFLMPRLHHTSIRMHEHQVQGGTSLHQLVQACSCWRSGTRSAGRTTRIKWQNHQRTFRNACAACCCGFWPSHCVYLLLRWGGDVQARPSDWELVQLVLSDVAVGVLKGG